MASIDRKPAKNLWVNLTGTARSFGWNGLRALRALIQERERPGHLAPVLGCVGRLLGCGAEDTARLYVFTQRRGWISAASRSPEQPPPL